MTGPERPWCPSAPAAAAALAAAWTGCRKAPPGAAILEGLHVNGDSVEGAGEEVAAWLDGLGL